MKRLRTMVIIVAIVMLLVGLPAPAVADSHDAKVAGCGGFEYEPWGDNPRLTIAVSTDDGQIRRSDVRIRLDGHTIRASVDSVTIASCIAKIGVTLNGVPYTITITDGGTGCDIVEFSWAHGYFGRRIISGNLSVVGECTVPCE